MPAGAGVMRVGLRCAISSVLDQEGVQPWEPRSPLNVLNIEDEDSWKARLR